MLIDDEQVVTQPRDDEAKIELQTTRWCWLSLLNGMQQYRMCQKQAPSMMTYKRIENTKHKLTRAEYHQNYNERLIWLNGIIKIMFYSFCN